MHHEQKVLVLCSGPCVSSDGVSGVLRFLKMPGFGRAAQGACVLQCCVVAVSSLGVCEWLGMAGLRITALILVATAAASCSWGMVSRQGVVVYLQRAT